MSRRFDQLDWAPAVILGAVGTALMALGRALWRSGA